MAFFEVVAQVKTGKNTSPRDFILAAMREIVCPMESNIGKFPEVFVPDEHWYERLSKRKNKLLLLQSLSENELASMMVVDLWEQRQKTCNNLKNLINYNKRIDTMIKEVKTWDIPSPEYETFRKRMIKELMDAKTDQVYIDLLRHKLSTPVTAQPSPDEVSEWKDSRVNELKTDIARYEKKWKYEQSDAKSLNDIAQALYKSLENMR